MNHISSAAAPTDPFKGSLVLRIYILKYLTTTWQEANCQFEQAERKITFTSDSLS